MPTRTLYLTNDPSPTFLLQSLLLDTVAPGGASDLGPGIFADDSPGNVDAGQWNPSTPIDDGDAATQLSASTGTGFQANREGWLYNVDLDGQVLSPGTWSLQLNLDATVGPNELGRLLMRVSVVRANGAVADTVACLLEQRITGEVSNVPSQDGWRDQNEARITVAAGAGNHAVTIAGAAQSIGHRFSAGERLFIELGFGDASNGNDRVWHLNFDNGLSFVTTPTIDPSASVLPFHVATDTDDDAAGLITLASAVVSPDDRDLWVLVVYYNGTAASLVIPPAWTVIFSGQPTPTLHVTVAIQQSFAGGSPAYNITAAAGPLLAGVLSVFRQPTAGMRVALDSVAPTILVNPVQDAIDYADFNPSGPCAVVAYGIYQDDNTYVAGPVIAGTNPALWGFLYFPTATGNDATIFGFIGDSDGAATGARTQPTRAIVDAASMGILLGLVAESASAPTLLTKHGRAPYLSQRMRRDRQRWS